MKHQIALHESLTLPLLQALLIDQQRDGDAEGVARTRRMIERLQERQRLRHQALRAGRWPFVVSEPEKGQGDGTADASGTEN